VRLFDRHPRGIHLTAAGRVLAKDAQRILLDVERAESRALRAGQAEIGVLRIAFYSSLAGGRLTTLLQAHRLRWPEVELVLIEADPVHQVGLLNEGQADLAVIAAAGDHHFPQFEILQWWTERMFVALPEDHPLAALSSLQWGDLRQETFVIRAYEAGPVIYNWLAQRLDPDDCLPNIQQQEVSREGLLGLVEAGFGLTVVSEPATRIGIPGVVYRPIADDNATIAIRGAWLRENVNPVLCRFRSFVREQLKASPPGRPASGSSPAKSPSPG
jgi:DNA-binding transcriptional LysR family regulator